jgi:hypothetical protein
VESGSSNWSPSSSSSDTEGDGRTGGASDFRGLFVVVEDWGSCAWAFLFTAVTDVEVLGSGSGGDSALGANDFYVLGPW